MMGLTIPGLGDALDKLDETSENMVALVSGLNDVAELLREQNEILRSKLK